MLIDQKILFPRASIMTEKTTKVCESSYAPMGADLSEMAFPSMPCRKGQPLRGWLGAAWRWHFGLGNDVVQLTCLILGVPQTNGAAIFNWKDDRSLQNNMQVNIYCLLRVSHSVGHI